MGVEFTGNVAVVTGGGHGLTVTLTGVRVGLATTGATRGKSIIRVG